MTLQCSSIAGSPGWPFLEVHKLYLCRVEPAVLRNISMIYFNKGDHLNSFEFAQNEEVQIYVSLVQEILFSQTFLEKLRNYETP